jgi:DNA-binding NtrC family response regulator
MIRRNNIDVVLLGLTTLHKEGLAILEMIKKVRPLTEVITINGSGEVALSIESMKLGAFDDFMGPFNIESLVERIHDASVRKKQREKRKRPLLERYMEIMSAGAFAEAGEQETALNFIKKEPVPASGPGNKEKKK